MFDRPAAAGAAVLVALDFGAPGYAESLDELAFLAKSAGLDVRGIVKGKRARPDPALFAGRGKVDEVRAALVDAGAGLALFNHELSPAQERNLERELGARVVDRTALILDIFAQRAKSHEGKVQVELAQLEHLATRLVRGWTHLERQKGGIGLRGPGETQLETDRRLLGKRVKLLKDRLAKLRRQRDVQRRARARGDVMAVSLVGYTNAGKSTLFNALTHASAYAANQLFATLDTTTRRVYLPGAGGLTVSDTVGFIRELPHTLVEAFRATLEETIHADLLLHVVDTSSSVRDQQIAEVNKVLAEIGADAIPQILVWNKIDLVGLEPGVDRHECGNISRVRLSAKTGAGLDLLRAALTEAAASRASAAQPDPDTIHGESARNAYVT
ncbi:MAG: GTPase HflX [Burkholderiales bacterium]|jgi:GTP-binding protein HflX|nr:GTPase HflX [Burkholderiales bacterium]